LLRELGTRKDILGQIFTKAQNKKEDLAKLYRLLWPYRAPRPK
jgi:type I restriction enzyme M protein